MGWRVDIINNHNIECDGDVVISEYFSSPSDKNAVVNEEYDYLIGNIQQFSKRTFQSFLKKSYDSLPLELQVHSRRNSETLKKYLFKEQVCNTAKKRKGKGAVCDASIR